MGEHEHYDMIGWVITSFFLIFLGSMLESKIENIKLTFLTILFGIIVTRLFLRSQYRKFKILYKEKEFFTNSSIWIYVGFMFLVQLFLLDMINLISLTSILVILIIMLILLIETLNIK